MDDPLNIAVCDNLSEDAENLRLMIEKSGIPAKIQIFRNGEAFLSSFVPGKYDLLFLDAYLESMTGIEVGKTVRNLDKNIIIIFFTVSEEYALEAYRLDALNYLVKPVPEEKITNALRLSLHIVKGRDCCTVIVKKKKKDIPFKKIYYIEVIDHTCMIHTVDGILETNTSMEDFVLLLPSESFLKCHRSFMVNLEHVKEIDRDFIMKNGDTVYVRGKDHKRMKKEYENFLRRMGKEQEVLIGEEH